MKIVTPSSRKIDSAERQRRQAQALRDNLARRKSQSRARDDQDQTETPPAPSDAKIDLSD